MNYIRPSISFNKLPNYWRSLHQEADEQLLKRLRKISIVKNSRAVPKIKTITDTNLERALQPEKLIKLVKLHRKDPLTWSPSVLSRIFKLSEHQSRMICCYVRPFLNLRPGENDESIAFKRNIVYDIEAFKSDKGSMRVYRKIVFPKGIRQELPISSIQDI